MRTKDQHPENDLPERIAYIYCRFSPRPNADDCKSNEKQAERCAAHCDKKGYEVAAEAYDKAVSGKSLDRPGLQDVLDALQPGDVLVVDSSDRLARDMLVNLTVRQRIADTGATLEFADGTPTDTTPEGKLFQNIMAAFASYERERINARTKSGLKRKRENGERTTGKIRIGWMLDPKDPKKLVRNLNERDAIIRMCELSAKGLSSGDIAYQLTHVIGQCRGKPWSPRTIRKLVKREAYWAGPSGALCLAPTHP